RLPVCYRLIFVQAIQIDCHIEPLPGVGSNEPREPFSPILAVHTIKPTPHPIRLTFLPRMGVHASTADRLSICEEHRRIRQLEIPTPPYRNVSHLRYLQGPVYPAAA